MQLAEWWADFDERVMRPVFNKPGAMDDWTPRGGGVLSSHANCGHTWQLAFPQQRPKLGSPEARLEVLVMEARYILRAWPSESGCLSYILKVCSK